MDRTEEMTSAYWRMRRLWAIEAGLMDRQIDLEVAMTHGRPL
jgi:hypothetical protein